MPRALPAIGLRRLGFGGEKSRKAMHEALEYGVVLSGAAPKRQQWKKERLMTDVRSALNGAVARGLIEARQVSGLERYLVDALPVLRPPGSIVDRHAEARQFDIVDTESPRFVRGFHDVLISIGAAILLAGAAGLGSIFAVLPAIIILAEILVIRQRLALPAVLLSVATAIWAFVVAALLIEQVDPGLRPSLMAALYVLPLPIIMGAFVARYRVPIALSMLIVSAAALVLLLTIAGLELVSGSPDFATEYPSVMVILFVLSALGLFATALRYDLSDPARTTRRSDIAFWLHLAAAPALLYAGLALTFLILRGDFENFELSTEALPAPPVIAIILVLMLIGLVIDRRAFVTSGLVSLIGTVYGIFRDRMLEGSTMISLSLLTVGVVVLTVGVGWQPLRRAVVEALPSRLKAKLPPLV